MLPGFSADMTTFLDHARLAFQACIDAATKKVLDQLRSQVRPELLAASDALGRIDQAIKRR